MRRNLQFIVPVMFLSLVIILSACKPEGKQKKNSSSFNVEETTIATIHEAMKSGELTSHQLVEAYLARIAKYDQPTQLNALVVVNPKALEEADKLDKEFRETGTLRPLHGIPVIVKDNYDTYDLQTAGGSLAMKGSIPPDDAYQVKKLREAGAIVLAKSNMAEWAFSPIQTVSSIFGVTRNPYDLNRVPAGSSGGTAAAVAANLGTVGLGTDTGNSIRGPSSHTSLVGIRSTIGLTSRDGIIPLYLHYDIGGPMARTVEDAVKVFQVIAGYDPADPITKKSEGKRPEDYTQFLDKEGLKGARIGVFRTLIEKPGADPEIKALMEQAITDIQEKGAEIVDSLVFPDIEKVQDGLWCNSFQYDVDKYLSSLGEKAPIHNISEVLKTGLYSPYIEGRLKEDIAEDYDESTEPCKDAYTDPDRIALREAIVKLMDDAGVDALIFPSWSNPPRELWDFESPAGNNCYQISPPTGLPAITVPMGFSHGNLPAGLQFVGRLFSEPDLIRFVYAYEQATQHRKPPEGFPGIEY